MPVTRENLDRLRCGSAYPTKNHDPSALPVSGLCHPGAAANLSYQKKTGNIRVTCSVCDGPVVEIAVASERRMRLVR